MMDAYVAYARLFIIYRIKKIKIKRNRNDGKWIEYDAGDMVLMFRQRIEPNKTPT